MARRLLNQTVPQGMAVSPEYAVPGLMPALQQRTLARRLRAERHLVILDNLESITGASLAIPNTLPKQNKPAYAASGRSPGWPDPGFAGLAWR